MILDRVSVNYIFLKSTIIIFLKFYAYEIVLTKSAIEEQAKFGSSVIRSMCVLPITFGKVQDCIENNEEMTNQ